jgi:hypothetical protein
MTRSFLLLLVLAVSALASPFPSLGDSVVEIIPYNATDHSLSSDVSSAHTLVKRVGGDINCWGYVFESGQSQSSYNSDVAYIVSLYQSNNNYITFV